MECISNIPSFYGEEALKRLENEYVVEHSGHTIKDKIGRIENVNFFKIKCV